MPPKRKNKAATKSMSTSTSKTAGRPRSSGISTKRKGQGEDWKQRRLASIPLHMTTRRAAKTTSNHSSSAASSSATSDSRRSSLNGIAQEEDARSEIDDERPAKLSRMSTESGSPQMSNGAFDNNTPMNGSQTSELQMSVSDATLNPPKTAGQKRRASDGSTQSSKTQNGVLTRTQSDVSEQQPRRKKRKTTETNVDSGDQPPDLTDASTAPNSPEQIAEVESSQNLQHVLPTNGDAPAKVARRLPGRRRQPHPDINVEIDLRRQLTLKTSYRSLAKVQKAILDELSNRTIRNLENDPEFYKNCPEYGPLMASLDQRRDSRLDEVNAKRTFKLEQLERERVAEEEIQRQQYINRFEDLRDDFLQQCYFRMKQIERERKIEQEDATDDEDNVLPPTYTDEPAKGGDDRLGSKFASRSRAYVEADRELADDTRRKLFDQARTVFVEKDEDANDSIDDISGGFARFAGPDRTEAITHYNITSLADAASEVERTPSPKPQPPPIQVIPNNQATQLMLLAEEAAHSREIEARKLQDQQQTLPYPQSETPVIKKEATRQPSPVYASPALPLAPLPSQAAHSSPVKPAQPAMDLAQYTPRSEPSVLEAPKAPEAPANNPPARTTHRITDMLNDDQEVPVSRLRESQPPIYERNTPSTPSRRENISQHNTPAHGGAYRYEGTTNNTERLVDQPLMDALSGITHRPSEPPSSPHSSNHAWQRTSVPPTRESEDELRRRDPRDSLRKIRELLDRKAREHGREPTERSSYSLPQYFGSQDRSEAPAYDPLRPSAGLYGASSSTSSYRHGSQDQGASHWDHSRRISESHAAQQPAPSPYQGSPPQPYQGEPSRQDPNPPAHQSPYALPAGPSSLPPKPPGPPPAPINFRFAHYDPAPPRPTYPSPTSNYPTASHPTHGPPPPHYGYNSQAPYPGGYIPPPGSFQAPPPPPNISPYPPLKIHQYGGQPILPANMAPPPHSGAPISFTSQASPPAFSPPQPQPPQPQYEQRDSATDRMTDPQSRPRRQYRSYHAPGTQFRNYQGPGAGRGRGN